MPNNYKQIYHRVLKEMAGVLLVAIVFTLVNLSIILLAQNFIPYHVGGYPYREIIDQYNLPDLLRPLTNFDGVQYLIIVESGYLTFQQAYFPLFPYLIKVFSALTIHNPAVMGMLISFISLAGGLFFINRLMNHLFPQYNSKKTVIHPVTLLLLILPCSYSFSAVYTESLFLFLTAGALYSLLNKRYILVIIFSFFASLTRFAGILLLIPIGIELYVQWKNQSIQRALLLLSGPVAGLVTYMTYLLITTNDALAFIHSQVAFSNNRSTTPILLPQVLYRYWKIFTTARLDFAYGVALFELSIFLAYFAFLIVGLWRLYREKGWKKPYGSFILGLLLYSCANLILPTLTGTLSSIPRYSLMSLAILPIVLEMKPWIKWSCVVSSLVLHMIALSLFTQGWFVS